MDFCSFSFLLESCKSIMSVAGVAGLVGLVVGTLGLLELAGLFGFLACAGWAGWDAWFGLSWQSLSGVPGLPRLTGPPGQHLPAQPALLVPCVLFIWLSKSWLCFVSGVPGFTRTSFVTAASWS